MKAVKLWFAIALGATVLALAAGCSRPPAGQPTPAPEVTAPATPTEELPQLTATPTEVLDTPTPAPTATPTTPPVTQADLDAGLALVRNFLAQLAAGEFRAVYGSLLTTAGQQRLADLVLGRLALSNPRISFFEVLGAEPVSGRIAVDVVWEETYEGQGPIGRQKARVWLARQDGAFLVDQVELVEYMPAPTPPPAPLPRAEALVNPAVPGQEMRFRASGFESGETVLTWLELPDGSLTNAGFQTADASGGLELAYAGAVTENLPPGRWIWWAQALRNSARNTGITFDVLPPPSPTATPTRPPVARQPTPRPAAAPRPAATPTPAPPKVTYLAPTLLWPEPLTSREWPGVLVVEIVPVAQDLAPDEYYELVLVARNPQGQVYNAGSVRSKGEPCGRGPSCRSVATDDRFMRLFYPDKFEGDGVWYVQVVRETAPGQFVPISPPSEQRRIILKPINP